MLPSRSIGPPFTFLSHKKPHWEAAAPELEFTGLSRPKKREGFSSSEFGKCLFSMKRVKGKCS